MSNSETESDDSMEKHLEELIREREEKKAPPRNRKKVKVPRRRSRRARSLNQLVIHQNTPKNGQCLYLAVLAATKVIGIEPGSSMSTPTQLRRAILNTPRLPTYLPADMQADVLRRIETGITTGSGNRAVGYDAWAGQEEIYMIATLYNLDIVIINFKENRICNATDFTNTTRQIILAYDGQHYDWCKLPNRTTVADLRKSVGKYNNLKF